MHSRLVGVDGDAFPEGRRLERTVEQFLKLSDRKYYT